MDLKAMFEQAVSDSRTITSKPNNDTLLLLYSLYKQATEGDVTGDEPTNPFDFVGKAKYTAWQALAGTDSATAMQRYIDLVKSLIG